MNKFERKYTVIAIERSLAGAGYHLTPSARSCLAGADELSKVLNPSEARRQIERIHKLGCRSPKNPQCIPIEALHIQLGLTLYRETQERVL